MRQPASSPATANVILTLVCALPDEALRPLLLRLLLQDGAAAPRETSDVSRRPGWPKGKPRGKRRVKVAEPTVEPIVRSPTVPDPKLAAQRVKDAAAKRRKRREVREGKANGTNGAHSTGTAATPSPAPAPDRATAKRARHANVMQARRARDRAARPANDAEKAAGTTAAARLWTHALMMLNEKEPWRPVAARLNLNMALCVDSWRSRGLPIGVTPAQVTRFVEAAPN
jgi:hypothetical protein